MIEEIIVSYVKTEREALNLPKDKIALLIMDVFRGQATREVISKLDENKIVLVQVPANMTHIFQPLDLTVNGYCKRFIKKTFAEWYSKQ